MRLKDTWARMTRAGRILMVAAAALALAAGAYLLFHRPGFARVALLADRLDVAVTGKDGKPGPRVAVGEGWSCDGAFRARTQGRGLVQLAIAGRGTLVLAGECDVTVTPRRDEFVYLRQGTAFFLANTKGRDDAPGRLARRPFDFTLRASRVRGAQGQPLVLAVEASAPVLRAEGALGWNKAVFQTNASATNRLRGLLGIDAAMERGRQKLVVKVTATNGDWVLRSHAYRVERRRWAPYAVPGAPHRNSTDQFTGAQVRQWQAQFAETRRLVREGKHLKDAAPLKAAYRAVGPRRFSGRFIEPLDYSVVSSGFAAFRYVTNDKGSVHRGIDYAARPGLPVWAAAPALVAFASNTVAGGNVVVLDHGLGVFSAYLHLSSLAVRAGEAVAAGQRLGAVGTTGLSTGPHLHFEVRIGDVCVDPLDWLAGTPWRREPAFLVPGSDLAGDAPGRER